MKNSIRVFHALVLCISVSISLISCKKEQGQILTTKGYLSLNLSVDQGLFISGNNLKSADPGEFMVKVFSDTDELYLTFPRVMDVPEVIELETGTYYVLVESGQLSDAAFETPYYKGISDEFTVYTEETVNIDVECTLANIPVSVTYSQNVINDFIDYNTTVSTAGAELVYKKDENRMGYFARASLDIECVLDYLDAQNNTLSRTISATIANPDLQKHYEIIVDLSLDSPQGVLNVTLNDTLITESIVLLEEPESDFAEGDIIITEFMANPDVLSDSEGEWMEFYNTTTENIDLQNFTVSRVGSSSTFTINQSLVVTAGEFVVLAVDPLASDQMDYDYSGFSLTNSSGQIQLSCPSGKVISNISYTSALVSAGQSAQLCPGNFNASDYHNMANWNLSTIEYMTGNTGSPGQANEACN